MEPKIFVFAHVIDIRDEPTQPALTWASRNAPWEVISLTVEKIHSLNYNTTWYTASEMSFPILNNKFQLTSQS